MSLAEKFEKLIQKASFGKTIDDVELSLFVQANEDAILAALRGADAVRDAVLEEAAATLGSEKFLDVLGAQYHWFQEHIAVSQECATAIRAMKENKHV